MVTLRRRLADGIVPALLSATVVIFAATDDRGAVLAGLCRELLAGSTEGRQALIGSCWYGPLPTLACLPFAWLLGGAGMLAQTTAAWFYWMLALILAGRMAVNVPPRLILQGLLVMVMVASGAGHDPMRAFTSVVALQGFRSATGWWSNRQTKDLVLLACVLALLTGCGLPLVGITLILAACVPLAALAGAETRRRLPAVILLGWLPMLYALAVWSLANWLILGDPIFFLRTLGGRHGLMWQGFRLALVSPTEMLGVLACLAALAGALVRRVPTAATAAVIGLLIWGWVNILRAFGVEWSAAAALTAMTLCGALALWLSRLPNAHARPSWNAGGDLLIFTIVACMVWRQMPAPRPEPDRAACAALCNEVESFIAARTPYGRVFACGYAGLGLLDGYVGDHMLPNFDLHIGALRKQYFGQHIFLLVHCPVGPAAMDNVHGRYPWLYEAGGSRAIFASDFGVWRLFEVIGAPTEEQLKAWHQR